MGEQVGGHGFGNVGLGVGGEPPRHRNRPAMCATEGHPGVTYHPQMDRTWCLCGVVSKPGDHVVWPKPTDCGGPLAICHHDPP